MIVGILGGTFDPPHVGHLGLAEIALLSGQVQQVWLVPCLEHRFGKQPEPFAERLAMCRLLVAGRPHLAVSDIESTLEKPGHTLDLVRALRAAHPEHAWRVLAGADIYHERGKWHRYDEIARLAPPLYVARSGVPPIPEPTLDAPEAVSSSELRDALARGERPSLLVPEAVLDYIAAHGLYRRT